METPQQVLEQLLETKYSLDLTPWRLLELLGDSLETPLRDSFKGLLGEGLLGEGLWTPRNGTKAPSLRSVARSAPGQDGRLHSPEAPYQTKAPQGPCHDRSHSPSAESIL